MSIGPDRVLEGLHNSKASLEAALAGEKDWSFIRWNQCTCGHIYAATMNGGELVPNHPGAGDHVKRLQITDPAGTDGLYEAVLRAVANANGNADAAPDELDRVVSSATLSAYDDGERVVTSSEDEIRRSIELVDNAIELVESDYEAARRQVAS